MILAWFENHVKEDLPPEHIWEDPEGLEEWWELVKDRKERHMSGGPSSGGSDESSSEMESNELARAFKEA